MKKVDWFSNISGLTNVDRDHPVAADLIDLSF